MAEQTARAANAADGTGAALAVTGGRENGRAGQDRGNASREAKRQGRARFEALQARLGANDDFHGRVEPLGGDLVEDVLQRCPGAGDEDGEFDRG